MNVLICRIMGHSVNKQSNTYSKFSKLLHTDDANVEDVYVWLDFPLTKHIHNHRLSFLNFLGSFLA